MAAAGILTEDDRVELIEGELIAMAPIGERHGWANVGFNGRLVRAVGDRALVAVGNPILLDQFNEPQPDFTLIRPEAFGRGPVTPADVLLVIELSDSSLRFDRGVKLPLYARAGIREFWIVNLQASEVEVCRGPQAGGYASIQRLGADAVLEPEALPGVRLRLAEVLP
ncbi:Uma2 family endonuclease [Leptolyngbya sp. 15MV]|nr:Uma2 family endonuclease [Leptolyngbya sp. 15MV]